MPLDPLNDRHYDAIKTLDTRVLAHLEETTRDLVRQSVSRGLQKGYSPTQIAKQLRATIGLSLKDEEAAANFRNMLETGDRAALSRVLRDKRFDRVLTKAFGPDGKGLTEKQIDDMVNGFVNQAARSRAETIARTAASDALKIGNQLSMQDAVDAGELDPDNLFARWISVIDDVTRPEHRRMNGAVRRYNESYSNGDTYPGEQDPWNCRCQEQFFVGRQSSRRRSR